MITKKCPNVQIQKKTSTNHVAIIEGGEGKHYTNYSYELIPSLLMKGGGG